MSRAVTTETEPAHAGRPGNRTATVFAGLCAVQGVYYLATGVWPLVSIETFEAVTGEKTDDWLVHTVGVLIIVTALVLLLAAWRGRPSPEVILLGVGSAIGLTAIDVIYVVRQVIPPIYLADAAAEVVLIAAWLWVAARTLGQPTPTGSRT